MVSNLCESLIESQTILDFTAARNDGVGGGVNSKTCKAPVRSSTNSISTVQQSAFYKLDALPNAQSTAAKYRRQSSASSSSSPACTTTSA